MSKEFYFGVYETAHKSKKMYYGVDDIAHEVAKAYIGVNGVARLFYQNVINISSAVVTLGTALTYNGSSQTQAVASVVVDGVTLVAGTDYTVSGNTGTNAGNYTLTITGIGDYEGSISSSWNIAKLSLAKPTVSGSFTYNGSAKTCTISNMNSTYITQSGTTSATTAGTYTVKFTLKSTTNTQWSDGTTATVSRTWSIAKATGSISVNPTSLSIVGEKGTTKTATITYTGDGSISVASSATDVATVNRSDKTVTVTSVGTGSATITITLAAGTNYTGASCTISITIAIPAFGSYNGEYELLNNVTIDGAQHKLYRLIGSGTLVLNDTAKYWMCAGGANGFNASYGTADDEMGYARAMVTGGHGGGGGYINTGTVTSGSWTVAIGAAGGASMLTNGSTVYQAKASTQNGASGGGAPAAMRTNSSIDGIVAITHAKGKGDGSTTYPFGLTSLLAHCAGGAGGGVGHCVGTSGSYKLYFRKGGAGGSNGNAGSGASSATISTAGQAVSGGVEGGGAGGRPSGVNVVTGGDATFYGSGGGGGALYSSGTVSGVVKTAGQGGAGYQGVVYIAVPA